MPLLDACDVAPGSKISANYRLWRKVAEIFPEVADLYGPDWGLVFYQTHLAIKEKR